MKIFLFIAALLLPGALFAETLLEFLEAQKEGDFIELETKKGKTIRGAFRSYDDDEEVVWYVPEGRSGIMKETSISIRQLKAGHSVEKSQSQMSTKSKTAPGTPNTRGRIYQAIDDDDLFNENKNRDSSDDDF